MIHFDRSTCEFAVLADWTYSYNWESAPDKYRTVLKHVEIATAWYMCVPFYNVLSKYKTADGNVIRCLIINCVSHWKDYQMP